MNPSAIATACAAAIGYLRCSTVTQVNSIPVQHGTIAASASRFGYTLAERASVFETDDPDIAPVPVPGCFHDYGVAASKVPFLKRPSVIAMIEFMAEHGIHTIVVAKMTRAFRNAMDCVETIRHLEKHGVRMVVLDVFNGQPLDTTNAASMFMLQVLAAAAEFETAQLAERINESNAYLRSQGYKIGELGYGWRLPDDAPPPGHPGRRRMQPVPDPDEQRILYRLLHGDLSRCSQRDACRTLIAEGVPTKKGGKWMAGTIDSIRKTGRLAPEFQHTEV